MRSSRALLCVTCKKAVTHVRGVGWIHVATQSRWCEPDADNLYDVGEAYPQ